MVVLHVVSTLLCLSGIICWFWILAYLKQKPNGTNFDINKINISAAFIGYFFNAWIFCITYLEFVPLNPILANVVSIFTAFLSAYIFTSINICNFHLLLYIYKENWATKLDDVQMTKLVFYVSTLISISQMALDKFLSLYIFSLPDPVFPILTQNEQEGFLHYGICNWTANSCLVITSIWHAYLKISKGDNLEEKKAYKILTLIIVSFSVIFFILLYFLVGMDLLEHFIILCYISLTFTWGTLLPLSIILSHENMKKYVLEKIEKIFSLFYDFSRSVQMMDNQVHPIEA